MRESDVEIENESLMQREGIEMCMSVCKIVKMMIEASLMSVDEMVI